MLKKAALVKSVTLRPHQESAIQKYLRNDNRQILAHSVGSGKTITSLGAVERSGAKKALILTPAALQKNYTDSIEKFVTPDSRKKYTVMSYEKFRMRPMDFINEIKPDTMIIDEFHRDKDPKGVSYNAIRMARPYVKNFMGLTGTIAQNGPQEIFPLVNLARGDDKGALLNKKQFENEYTSTKRVYPKGFSGILARLMGRSGEIRVLKNESKLKSLIGPYIDKNDPDPNFLAEFPKKEIVNVDVPMSPKQQKVYDYFMKKDLNFIDRWKIRHNLPSNLKGENKFFTKLIRARQASDSPNMFSDDIKDKNTLEYSGKLTTAYDHLLKHLKENKRNKIMIYSNFQDSSLRPLADALNKSKIPFGEFSGQATKKSKNTDVELFNKGKKRVLLVSPSGAEGLDLKGVTLLQQLEGNWNPKKTQQIQGRAVRYKSHEGLPEKMRNVKIEQYLSTIKPSLLRRMFGKKQDKSIDQYIYDRAAEKEHLVDQIGDLL